MIETKKGLTHEKIMNMTMEEKLDHRSGQVSNRVIQQIYSKGTFSNSEKESYEPQYVMSIARNTAEGENNIGVCYFDISTFKCYLGCFVDNQSNNTLRTVISKIRPVELVYDPLQLTKEMCTMLKNLPL